MATSVSFVGDGTLKEIDLTFPYLDRDDIHVFVDSVEVDFTWVSNTRVKLEEAAEAGASWLVRRITPVDEALVSWQDGAVLSAADLALADTQLLYRQQEDSDTLDREFGAALRVPPGETVSVLEVADDRAEKVFTFNSSGAPSLVSHAALAAALAATGELEGFKGDPGGNVMAIGLFSAASGLTIAVGTDLVRTAGYSAAGRGSALYSYDAAVDAAYVTANPRTSFVSANGRGFKLAELIVTPYMFGAVGDGTTDDAVPYQAALDHLYPEANSHLHADLRGHFATSQPLYAVYRNATDSPTAGLYYGTHYTRHIIAGEIRVLPVASQPGGVAMTYVLTIAGAAQKWDGQLFINGKGVNNHDPLAYDGRRFVTGVRMVHAVGSAFGPMTFNSAKRDGVFLDPTDTVVTLRAGTAYETRYNYSNNIGVKIESITGTAIGPLAQVSSFNYTRAVSAIDQGGSADDIAWNTNQASFVNSHQQRSKLTVPSTAELKVHDLGRVDFSRTASTYTTMAVNATTGTFTWTAGDPSAEGFQVGDRFKVASGANAADGDGYPIWYEILSFSGTSNRTITVSPKPSTTAAAADLGAMTAETYHQITGIPDSTTLYVYPWVPDRNGSSFTWVSCHGFAFNCEGSNTGNVRVGYVHNTSGNGAVGSRSLYGPKIESVLGEANNISVQFGKDYTAVCYGFRIDHYHAESYGLHLYQATAGNSTTGYIGTSSAFRWDRVRTQTPRTATTDGPDRNRGLISTTVDLGGTLLVASDGRSHLTVSPTTLTLTNVPGHNKEVLVSDGACTVTLGYDFDIGRLFGREVGADLRWMATAGGAPAGTLTFQLSTDLTQRGWTIVGTNPVAAPSKASKFEITFVVSSKKVFVDRFAAA